MGVNKKGKHKKSRARKQNTEATSDAGDTEKGKLKEDNDSVKLWAHNLIVRTGIPLTCNRT